jgi:hypothetical protein
MVLIGFGPSHQIKASEEFNIFTDLEYYDLKLQRNNIPANINSTYLVILFLDNALYDSFISRINPYYNYFNHSEIDLLMIYIENDHSFEEDISNIVNDLCLWYHGNIRDESLHQYVLDEIIQGIYPVSYILNLETNEIEFHSHDSFSPQDAYNEILNLGVEPLSEYSFPEQEVITYLTTDANGNIVTRESTVYIDNDGSMVSGFLFIIPLSVILTLILLRKRLN